MVPVLDVRLPRPRCSCLVQALDTFEVLFGQFEHRYRPPFGFGTVGVKSCSACWGPIPDIVAWLGFLSVGLGTTWPPAARTCPAVVAPTCRLGMPRLASSSVSPTFTETP